MSKVREFHKLSHAHHQEMADVHAGHAETHKAMMAEHDEDSAEHLHHKTEHELHKRAHATHSTLADFHKCEMDKAVAAGDLSKAAPGSLEEVVKRMVAEAIENTAVPTRVSAIAPGPQHSDLVRAIPRAGARPIPTGAELPAVATEFTKLFAIDDSAEDPLRQ